MASTGADGKAGVVMKTVADYAVSSLRQSDVVFASILFAFLFFITARNELPKYIQVFI